jgi:hypothetical protein
MMKRIARHVAIASLTFIVGLSCVLLPATLSQLKGYFEEPVVEAPSMVVNDDPKRCHEVYEESRAPDDFGQFWSEFKSAVSRDDRERLYELTAHDEFSWEPGDIKLHHKLCGESGDYYFVIKNFDDFSQSYDQLFTASVKKQILKQTPLLDNQHFHGISWLEGKGRYRTSSFLEFSDSKGRGFKFIGALMGPG